MHLKSLLALFGMFAILNCYCLPAKAQLIPPGTGGQGINNGGQQDIKTSDPATESTLKEVNQGVTDVNKAISGIYDRVSGLDKKDFPLYIKDAEKFVTSMIESMTMEHSKTLNNIEDYHTSAQIYGRNQKLAMDVWLKKLTKNLINMSPENVILLNNGEEDKIPADIAKNDIPYAKDLLYTNLMGINVLSNGEGQGGTTTDTFEKYARNAGGLNLFHKVPLGSWPSSDDKYRYQGYFNTVMAIESYNAYLMRHLKIDAEATQLQKKLMKMATDKEFLSDAATAPIGYVLRQILMFQAATFALLAQSIELQKEMVVAQALNNAAVIAAGTSDESQLTSRASS